MEMDCNLNKLAIFFKLLLYIIEKSLKTDCNLLFLVKSLNIFPPVF